MEPNIGAITEQGDLGLGFDVLNEQDQNTYKNQQEAAKNDSEKEWGN